MATNRKQRRDFFKKNKKRFAGLTFEEFNKGVPKTKPIINKEKNI